MGNPYVANLNPRLDKVTEIFNNQHEDSLVKRLQLAKLSKDEIDRIVNKNKQTTQDRLLRHRNKRY